MEKEIIELIVKVVSALIGLLLAKYIVPYLKSLAKNENMQLFVSCAEIGVRAAEQLFNEDECKIKKSYVLDYLTVKANEFGLDLTEEDIDNIIESSVNYIKYGMEYSKE